MFQTNNKAIAYKKNKTIPSVNRVLITTLLSCVVLLIFAVIVAAYIDIKGQYAWEQHSFEKTADAAVLPAKIAVELLDPHLAEQIVKGLISIQGITSAYIADDFGRVMAQYKTTILTEPLPNQIMNSLGISTRVEIVRTFRLENGEQAVVVINTVLGINTHEIFAIKFFSSIVLVAFIIFLVGIAIFFVGTRPLLISLKSLHSWMQLLKSGVIKKLPSQDKLQFREVYELGTIAEIMMMDLIKGKSQVESSLRTLRYQMEITNLQSKILEEVLISSKHMVIYVSNLGKKTVYSSEDKKYFLNTVDFVTSSSSKELLLQLVLSPQITNTAIVPNPQWSGSKVAYEIEIEIEIEHSQIHSIVCINLAFGDMAFLIKDISLEKKTENNLKKMATSDTLTNLPNRYHFMDILTKFLTENTTLNNEFAVFFIDLDNFKNINDSLGHHIGDLLLIEVSQRLSQCISIYDCVARFSGDEFVILLKNNNDKNKVLEITNNILTKLSPAFYLESFQVFITASIGIALYPQHGLDSLTLIRNADNAMYHAKD